MVAALALEIEHRVDHVLEHARAGDRAFLGDVADEDSTAKPRRLASRISSCAAARTWPPCRARESSVSTNMVWIESMTTTRGASARRARRRCRARWSRRRAAPALRRGRGARRACGLVDRLLAGDVGARRASAGERGRDLEQQGGFADAGIAADQERRAGHQPAAEHAVELGDAGRAARRPRRPSPCSAGELDVRRPLPPLSPRGGAWPPASSTMAVPGAAGVAAARPLRMHRAAGLADIARRRLATQRRLAPRRTRRGSSAAPPS